MDAREQTRTREHGREVTNPANFADPGMARIEAVKRIVEEKTFAKIDGCMLDLYSASAIANVYDAINEENQRKYRNMDVRKMASIAFKLLK